MFLSIGFAAKKLNFAGLAFLIYTVQHDHIYMNNIIQQTRSPNTYR